MIIKINNSRKSIDEREIENNMIITPENNREIDSNCKLIENQ